jgi:site-specific recombinase XerD
MATIQEAMEHFITNISLARSDNTAKTYHNALSAFANTLQNHQLKLQDVDVSSLSEDSVGWFAMDLKIYSPSTERLYLTAINNFFEFLAAEQYSSPNLPRIKGIIRQKARRPGLRLPQVPREKIEDVINHMINLSIDETGEPFEVLRDLRDRAFILTLADTGLRVNEACSLKRGDIDWNEGKAILIGKGNRQAVVRFSIRSMQCLKDYLNRRAALDGSTRKPLASLPLFARHDRGAGKKILKMTTTTGRNIINDRVIQALGEGDKGLITPHSFRHYFVTTVLRGSGNLKLAQELARHRNIAVTQRYAHLSDDELDEGYWKIFENDKSK